MKYTFPATYGQNELLVPIDEALIPLIAGVLNRFFIESYWNTREDYELGYNAFAELLANMTGKAMKELIEAVNRIYRLHDVALNGTQYEVVDGQITPAIPAVPPAEVTAANAGRAQLRRLHQLAENAATAAEYDADSAMEGTTGLDYEGSWTARLRAVQGLTGGFFGIGATPVTLADLAKASRVNNAADQGLINNGVEEVLTAISQGTGIAGTIADLLGQGAEIATDGGLMAVQIAVMTAQASAASAQLLLSQRIIKALDGGELGGSGSANNNVLSHLGAGLFHGEPKKTIHEVLYELINDSGKPPIAALLENIDLQTATLYDILPAIRQLAGLEAAGQLVEGSALKLTLNLLECICQGVTGTPAEFPPFVTSDCDPSFTLRAQVSAISFDSQGAAELDFEIQGGAGTITTTLVPGVGSCLVVGASGPREICMQVVRAGGAENEILGIVCTPVRVSNGGEGGRPGVQLQGLAQGDSGTFWGDASDNGEQIAYYCTIATGVGTPPVGQYRLYLAAGPVG